MGDGGGYDEYGFIADLYDHVGPYRSRPDVAFFLNEAVNAGSPVLELGCGTGRVLIPIARAGIDIVGVDLSSRMHDYELIYYVTHPDGREERLVHAFSLRYLFRFEAEHLLVRSGFDVEQVYAAYDKSPYGSMYPGELIFIARARS
jgi:SAM-dependent methyltransferase